MSLWVLLPLLFVFSSEMSCFFLIFLSLTNLLFYSTSITEKWVKIDNLNFLMICFSLLLWSVVLPYKGVKMNLIINLIFLLSIIFFSTDQLIIFFICYELSLVPLMILLICWGQQAERIKACQYMILYTIVFSSPLLLLIILTMEYSSTISIILFSPKKIDNLLLICGSLAFLVKAPILTLHSWLPKAHVESPLEGSMILAGIMLKFGIYGLIRLSSMFILPLFMKLWMFFFCLFSSIISSIQAISSDDMKMSVAYSSISHMNFLLCSIFTEKLHMLKGCVMIMISHGFSSPLLFFIITMIYSLTHSRSMLTSKGIGSKLTFMSMMAFICWSLNFSAPPSLSFLGEMNIIPSILSKGWMNMIWVMFYIMMISFFSMLNYGIIFHSSTKSLTLMKISLKSFSILFWGIMILVIMFFYFEGLWL